MGYALLANTMEKTSEMPIEYFLKTKISTPLHLRDSYVFYKNMKNYTSLDYQKGYGFEVKMSKKYFNDLTSMYGLVGDGNLYFSAEDLLKWD